MKFEDIFNGRGLLKILLIVITILLWMFFYGASRVSLRLLVIFDIPSIINTFLTVNFLMFIILFPLTSTIIIAMSAKGNKWINLIHIFSGVVIGFILSMFFYGISSKGFLLFALFFIISNLLVSLLTFSKYSSEKNPKIFSIASYAGSKMALLLTISLFIITILLIQPAQESYAKDMEAGIVNMFVGDDISNWLGASYDISKASSKATLDYITASDEYLEMMKVNDQSVQNFTTFIDSFKEGVLKKTTPEDLKAAFPNLNTPDIKDKVLLMIRSIPVIVIIEHYFALFFAFAIASISQIYFSIAFGLLGLLYVYLFFILFSIGNDNQVAENKQSEKKK